MIVYNIQYLKALLDKHLQKILEKNMNSNKNYHLKLPFAANYIKSPIGFKPVILQF